VGTVIVVVKDAGRRFLDDDMTDHAAALTYYTLMSLFPALLVGVALLGLLGQESTVDDVARYLGDHGAPESTVNAVRSSLETAVSSHSGSSGVLLAIGLAVALYGASGAFGAAGRALNVVYRAEEERGIVHRKALQLGSTMLLIVLCLIVLVAVFLGGGVARELFDAVGLGSGAATAWSLLRWPLAVAVAMVIYSYVYWAAPDRRGAWRWISPGAAVAVLIWIAASAGFFFYVDNFGSYNATYGAFATVVILLVWLWLTNVALLFGAELNAALERARPGRRAESSPAPTSTGPAAPGSRHTATGAGAR
jgi:membrane protein